ncbi:MAG: lysophospholipid acyltransferase family protein [Woeseiaceae bacterium]
MKNMEFSASMSNTILRAAGKVAGYLWAIYAWVVFVIGVSAALLAALLLPGKERRRRWVSTAGRGILAGAGIKAAIRGLEKIPTSQCIVVANHASYLDGVILNAFLPPRFGFVIKGEMGRIPVAGYLLRRIGSVFVERFDVSGSARDARRLLKVADAGESLAFFPEGTFLHKPGLDRFRAGAFAAAINSNLPVVPIVIFGSRHILPSQTLRPRHGHLRLEVLNPIEPTNPAFENSKDLAELARQRILTVLDEPDLLAETAA